MGLVQTQGKGSRHNLLMGGDRKSQIVKGHMKCDGLAGYLEMI